MEHPSYKTCEGHKPYVR